MVLAIKREMYNVAIMLISIQEDFYQPATCKVCSQLILRLLCFLRI